MIFFVWMFLGFFKGRWSLKIFTQEIQVFPTASPQQFYGDLENQQDHDLTVTETWGDSTLGG